MNRVKAFFATILVALGFGLSVAPSANASVVGVGDYLWSIQEVGVPPGTGVTGSGEFFTFGVQPGPAPTTFASGVIEFGGNTGTIIEVFGGFNPFGVYDQLFTGVGPHFVLGLELLVDFGGGNEIFEFDNDPGGNPNRALVFTMSGLIQPTLVEFRIIDPSHVPEPGSFPLFAGAVIGLGFLRRRRPAKA